MLTVHNERLLGHLRDHYRAADVARLRRLLAAAGTFTYPRLANGLFPAAAVSAKTSYTGYARVWVRDNVHLAQAAHVLGRTAWAVDNLQALARFFATQAPRFDAIIAGAADPEDVGRRPAIRFDGHRLRALGERWPHAQNDALGYFLWMYCRLVRERAIPAGAIAWDVLLRFPPYFRAIRYWRDEDSGHWEERRKIEASSIGVVVAGLEALRALAPRDREQRRELDDLIARGRSALAAILPAECVQRDPRKRRRHDSALLFLIWPLAVVGGEMAERIIEGVCGTLQGEQGVRRYLGDSFWCADYKRKLPAGKRTTDWSGSLEIRDALMAPGQEAEWCLFDPVLSIIFGRRYQRTGAVTWRQRQVHHLNRSLGQLTAAGSGFPELRCPELYYRERGRWTPSDATPLLWTQAMLEVALATMARSVALGRR
jgi:hypothetical protein